MSKMRQSPLNVSRKLCLDISTFLLQDCRYASSTVQNIFEQRSVAELAYIQQPGQMPLENMTVGCLLERAAEQWPNRDFVISLHQNVRLSFSEVLMRADRLAAGLIKIGLRRGDHIGIWSPNYYQWILSYMAGARAGLVIAGINPMFYESEFQFCVEKIGMKAIFAPASHRNKKYADIMLTVKKHCPFLEHIITFDDDHVTGTRRLRDIEELANKREIEAIKKEQSAISMNSGVNIQFTSGTTGKSKAVVLSHRSLVNNAKQVSLRIDLNNRKICLNVPLFHAFGMVSGVTAPMHTGSIIVLENFTFNPMTSVNTIIQEKCDVAYATPTMWINMIDVQNKLGLKIASLYNGLIGGAPVSPNLYKRIRKYLHLDKIQSIYGLTEATGIICQSYENEPTELTDTTVGHVSDHLEVKVVDKNDNIVPFGSSGELCVRGYSTMIGYWNDEENTNKVLSEDKWLKTGDQFILYKNGYGCVIGRIKDMIIRGGENIFPVEIESFYESHPAICEVQVIGVYDEIYGEEICAFIRLRAGAKLTNEDIINYATGKIAHFKIPRYIQFRNDFPKTASGKVQKFKLKEEVEKQKLVPKKPEN
ncbi:PREDICTED: acyl-CoA synthetase family member 2, mitochondrial [Ceratosolen solmsi marchali]|uniref:Medium-chain acyl-CoA ligase ACSF2, mitochondrial n=1 Tax=Ceratosolen solmsi marchali TaxID=326594 RepID=A0AAJ6YLJ6_9HYME|nr:PREDICTED: acyl-CoA synthetase family member 2, mitochondrial [Ceratosolen solmsi marchali]